ncbi:MAG: universal stress protein [Alphaproteobacteria bacterium]|nr:universal stress protein [Alphaproteobacteria bacterium]
MKIGIAIDGSPLSIAAMDMVMLMAHDAGCSVDVVHVHDDLMLKMAESPLVRFVSPFAARKMPRDEIERAMRLQLKIVKDTFDFIIRSARTSGVNARLVIKKGMADEQLVQASGSYDLFVMPWAGWQVRKFYYAGPQAASKPRFSMLAPGRKVPLAGKTAVLLENAGAPVLMAKNSLAGQDWAVFYDGSAGSDRALKWALKNLPGFMGGQGTALLPKGKSALKAKLPEGMEARLVKDLSEAKAALVVCSRAAAKKITKWETVHGSVLVV